MDPEDGYDQYDEDGGYGDYDGQYDDQPEMNEEDNAEEKIQMEYYTVDSHMRNNEFPKAITLLQDLFKIADEKGLKSWKSKILNNLLEIYGKQNDVTNIKATLEKILTLNAQDKLLDGEVKAILSTFKGFEGSAYNTNKGDIKKFIESLSPLSRIKGYLLMIDRAIGGK